MKFANDENGFSLVELLIALTLLGTVVVASIAFFASVINSPRLINNNTIALNLARDRIEFLRQFENTNIDRNNTAWNTLPDRSTATNPVSYTQNVNNTQFTVTSNVHSVSDTTLDSAIQADTSLIPVTVTVSWTEKGANKSIRTLTIFSRRF